MVPWVPLAGRAPLLVEQCCYCPERHSPTLLEQRHQVGIRLIGISLDLRGTNPTEAKPLFGAPILRLPSAPPRALYAASPARVNSR